MALTSGTHFVDCIPSCTSASKKSFYIVFSPIKHQEENLTLSQKKDKVNPSQHLNKLDNFEVPEAVYQILQRSYFGSGDDF